MVLRVFRWGPGMRERDLRNGVAELLTGKIHTGDAIAVLAVAQRALRAKQLFALHRIGGLRRKGGSRHQRQGDSDSQHVDPHG